MILFARASELIGVPETTVRGWERAGLLPISAGGGRHGLRKRLDSHALTIALVIAAFRRQGAAPEVTQRACQLLVKLGARGMAKNLDCGRRILIAQAERAEIVAANFSGIARMIAGGLEGAMILDLAPICQRALEATAEQPPKKRPA